MNKGKSINKSLIAIVILSLTTAAGIILSICLIAGKNKVISVSSTAPTYSEEDLQTANKSGQDEILANIHKHYIEGGDTIDMLRDFFPQEIIYFDDNSYQFVKLDKSLKQNNLKNECFKVADNGEISYIEEGVTTYKGIDISSYQRSIDFAKVKASGIDYAIIRTGYRGYGSSGKLVTDDYFESHITNALKNNLDVGVYFFTQAINKEEAVEEANYVLEQIRPYNVKYPVIIDVEDIAVSKYRQQNLTKEELTDVVIAFCDTIKAAGYTPMIYANLRYFIGKLDYERLEAYEKWYAYYNTELYFPYEISMWQYSSTGKVDGIEGNVDLNISFKKWY